MTVSEGESHPLKGAGAMQCTAPQSQQKPVKMKCLTCFLQPHLPNILVSTILTNSFSRIPLLDQSVDHSFSLQACILRELLRCLQPDRDLQLSTVDSMHFGSTKDWRIWVSVWSCCADSQNGALQRSISDKGLPGKTPPPSPGRAGQQKAPQKTPPSAGAAQRPVESPEHRSPASWCATPAATPCLTHATH